MVTALQLEVETWFLSLKALSLVKRDASKSPEPKAPSGKNQVSKRSTNMVLITICDVKIERLARSPSPSYEKGDFASKTT